MNNDANGIWVGVTTFPSIDVARQVATALVEERLIACCNLVPNIESIYRWQGAVENSSEILGLLKFPGANETLVRARLLELHPYEVAEWVAWPLQAGAPLYLDWVAKLGD